MSSLRRTSLSASAIILLISAACASAFGFHVAAARGVSGAASLPGLRIGVPHLMSEHAWVAYYDGHKDSYVNTDVSSKSQAASLGVNYAPILAHSLNASSPMYFVKGRSAAGQIAVFGSEPGGSDYSPLWREIWVKWKAGVTPVLLVRDDQINELAKAGKLTKRMTNIILNAPVLSVGH